MKENLRPGLQRATFVSPAGAKDIQRARSREPSSREPSSCEPSNHEPSSRAPLSRFSIWAGISALSVLLLGRIYPGSDLLQSLLWPCPLKAISGVPCVTCGSTRVSVLLASGDFSGALFLAPIPTLALFGGLLLGATALLAFSLGRRGPDRGLYWLLLTWPGRATAGVTLLALYGLTLWRFFQTGAP